FFCRARSPRRTNFCRKRPGRGVFTPNFRGKATKKPLRRPDQGRKCELLPGFKQIFASRPLVSWLQNVVTESSVERSRHEPPSRASLQITFDPLRSQTSPSARGRLRNRSVNPEGARSCSVRLKGSKSRSFKHDNLRSIDPTHATQHIAKLGFEQVTQFPRKLPNRPLGEIRKLAQTDSALHFKAGSPGRCRVCRACRHLIRWPANCLVFLLGH